MCVAITVLKPAHVDLDPVPETCIHGHMNILYCMHACMLAIRGTIGKLNNTHVLDVGVGQLVKSS